VGDGGNGNGVGNTVEKHTKVGFYREDFSVLPFGKSSNNRHATKILNQRILVDLYRERSQR